ncbi:rhomboid family intramembrane serine protease [Pelagicoccus albus]|uniref:Rhomboid family intramembrane serine protease n=1 Tax=Pelagicoccus albus TaxID=415222 RepID=A0A7X1BAF2_9BACT|nr:rhomboid family intramembrane serine protease [Pelagicoccus albus]MBC2607305.1 rhomboid family intramembrane serine protease [Pelagicoccus albus]
MIETNEQNGGFEDSEQLAVLGSYRTTRLAHEAGLAVLAYGEHYWVHMESGRYLLVVRREQAEALKREVEISTLRNRYWPPQSLELPVRSIRKGPTILAILGIILAFSLQTAHPEISTLGVNNSQAVWENGEWWRIFTAMTLHADLSHLAGNLLGLSLFGYLSCRYLGNGLAWFLIVISAAASNATSILANLGQDYQSLGASTAVFAALGLIAGFPLGVFLRAKEPIQQRDWLIPFFGGCVLFAWMGGGEFPTDVAAHLWSFGYGALFATLIGVTALHAKLKKVAQSFLLLAAGTLLGAAWFWASLT